MWLRILIYIAYLPGQYIGFQLECISISRCLHPVITQHPDRGSKEKAKYFRAVRRLFNQLDRNGDGGLQYMGNFPVLLTCLFLSLQETTFQYMA